MVTRLAASSGDVLLVHRPRIKGLAGWSGSPGFAEGPDEPRQPAKRREQPIPITTTDGKDLIRLSPLWPMS
jgi:hypothetical protein